jgi:hypothetical protein
LNGVAIEPRAPGTATCRALTRPIFGALLGDAFRYSLAATMVVTLGVITGFRPAQAITAVFAPLAMRMYHRER